MRLPLWALCLACACVALPAAADQLEGEALVERTHRIALTLSPGVARMRVRRAFFNRTNDAVEALLRIDLPPGAVASDLRFVEHGNWRHTELWPAELAAARYENAPAGAVGATALLSSSEMTRLDLALSPCPAQAVSEVEYTLTMPTEYRAGAHHLALGAIGSDARLATVTAAGEGGELYVDGHRGARVELSRSRSVDLALSPARPAWLGGGIGLVPVGANRLVTHVHLEAAPSLSQLPRGARIVVVLDHSRSIADPAAQLALARATISLVPDARVLTLWFDRTVHRVEPGFVAAPRAIADLAALMPVLHNGSEVALALREAQRALASEPASVPHRILLFTDALGRSALSAEVIDAELDGSALVHTVIASEGDASLEVYDDHPWRAAMRSTGGLVWLANAPRRADDALRSTAEELLRPKVIRHLSMNGPGFAEQIRMPDRLAEGEGVGAAWIASEPLDYLRIDGELWSKPVHLKLVPDARESRLWARLAIGNDVVAELEPHELLTVAWAGQAVSDATSFFAPGGATVGRPPQLAFGRDVSIGQTGTSGHGDRGSMLAPNHQGVLEAALDQAWQRCRGPGHIAVALETSRAEVVEVTVGNADLIDAPLERCVREELWQLDLPADFRDEWQSWSIETPRPKKPE